MEKISATKKRARQEKSDETSSQRTRSQSNKRARSTPGHSPGLRRSLQQEIEDIIQLEDEEEKSKMADNPIEPSSVRTLADMAQLLKSELQKMPTKEYMDQKIGTIDRRTRKNEEAIVQLRNTVAEIGRRQEETMDGRITGPVASYEEIRATKFNLALRTLRIWPIIGKTDTDMSSALDDFMKGALLIEETGDQRIIYSNVERVQSLPRSRQHNEVKVTFKEPHMRDIVLSYARNLQTYVSEDGQPTAGLRMEIPDYLAKTHKQLDTYGYYLKQKHGKHTRRIIKYDIPEMSLFLSYRLPNSPVWKRISPALARAFCEREDERNLLDFSNACLLYTSPSPRDRQKSRMPSSA